MMGLLLHAARQVRVSLSLPILPDTDFAFLVDAPSHSSIILVLESLGQRGLDPSSGLVGSKCPCDSFEAEFHIFAIAGCFTFQHGRDCTTGQPLCCPTLSNSTTHGLVGTACTPIEFID